MAFAVIRRSSTPELADRRERAIGQGERTLEYVSHMTQAIAR
jgi:hypothetical protein